MKKLNITNTYYTDKNRELYYGEREEEDREKNTEYEDYRHDYWEDSDYEN